MNQNIINLTLLQNNIDIELQNSLRVIAPIIAGKKVTKREVDKCKVALLERNYNVSVYLKKESYSKILVLMAIDRSIPDANREGALYAHDNSLHIYLDNESTSITSQELERYKRGIDAISESEVIANIELYNNLSMQIKELETQRSSIKYNSYLK